MIDILLRKLKNVQKVSIRFFSVSLFFLDFFNSYVFFSCFWLLVHFLFGSLQCCVYALRKWRKDWLRLCVKVVHDQISFFTLVFDYFLRQRCGMLNFFK